MYSAIWQYRRRDLFLLRTPDLGSENNTWYMYVNVYLKYTRLIKYLLLFHFFFEDMWWEAQTHTNILPHLQPQTIWYFTSLLRLPCNVCKVDIHV